MITEANGGRRPDSKFGDLAGKKAGRQLEEEGESHAEWAAKMGFRYLGLFFIHWSMAIEGSALVRISKKNELPML